MPAELERQAQVRHRAWGPLEGHLWEKRTLTNDHLPLQTSARILFLNGFPGEVHGGRGTGGELP